MDSIPDILLYKIISYLSDDIDRICLILVCQHTYRLRSNLLFNIHHRVPYEVIDPGRLESSKFHFNSFIDSHKLSFKYVHTVHYQNSANSHNNNNNNSNNQNNNNEINYDQIPATVKYLTIHHPRFQLSRLSQYKHLTHLTLIQDYEYFEEIQKGYLPNGLTHLRLNRMYNHPLGDVLPNTLTHLYLGEATKVIFKRDVDKYITGYSIVYHDPVVDNSNLPESLVYIETGSDYHVPITDTDIPKGLETIKLGIYSHSKLNLAKSNSIKTIQFSYIANAVVNVTSLPKTLTSLDMGNISKDILFNPAPNNLASLPNLTHLIMGPHTSGPQFTSVHLPVTLTHLELPGDYNQQIQFGSLPASLLYLKFGYCFNRAIPPNTLPPMLTTLIFGYCFNQELSQEVLPMDSLKHLQFGKEFNKSINSLFNNSSNNWKLETIIFGQYFNQEVEFDKLPGCLKSIQFGQSYSHLVPVQLISPTLESIVFERYVNANLLEFTLPTDKLTNKVMYIMCNHPTELLKYSSRVYIAKKNTYYTIRDLDREIDKQKPEVISNIQQKVDVDGWECTNEHTQASDPDDEWAPEIVNNKVHSSILVMNDKYLTGGFFNSYTPGGLESNLLSILRFIS